MDHATASEHRRLAILRHLAELSTYTSNASILADVLRGLGIATTEDQLRAALTWLQEAELVKLTHHDDFTVATATGRGVEVARGEAVHPGVKRPSARR